MGVVENEEGIYRRWEMDVYKGISMGIPPDGLIGRGKGNTVSFVF